MATEIAELPPGPPPLTVTQFGRMSLDTNGVEWVERSTARAGSERAA
jgi:hypothetical protein